MKSVNLLVALTALSSIYAQTSQNNIASFIDKKYCNPTGSKTCILISQEDFWDNGTYSKTYVINNPGTYCLKDNINFDPQVKVASAIEINSDNVILDLNGKSLEQVNSQTQVTGIEAITGHRNITILGNYGSIKNFSQRGIYIQGGNQFITIGETPLFITGNGKGTPIALIDEDEPILQAGLLFGEMAYLANFGFPSVKGSIEDVTISRVTLSDNNIGVLLGDGANYYFTDNNIVGNNDSRKVWKEVGYQYYGSEEDSVISYGLAYFSSNSTSPSPTAAVQPNTGSINNLQFINCHFDCTVADASQSDTTFQAYCDGFNMAISFSALKFNNCTFNNNEAKLAPRTDVNQFNQTRGCVIGGGSSIVIENSEFSNNKGGGFVDGLNVSGLLPDSTDQELISQPKSLTLRNCVASNNQGRSNGALIVNSGTMASGSQGLSDQKALDIAGFVIRYPSGCSLINCVAEDNTGFLEDAEKTDYNVFTDGILLFANIEYPENATNNVDIRGAKVSRNRSNATQGTSSGIRVLDGLTDNITIRDSVITENSNFDQTADFFAAGVDITGLDRGDSSLITVRDCVINSHNLAGVYTTLSQTTIQNNTISDNGTGVILASFEDTSVTPSVTGYSDFSTVIGNTFLSNGAAVEDQPSQQPTARFSTSLVANNTAFNNAQGYLVTYGPAQQVPVETGTLTAYPAYPPAVLLSNANIERPAVPPLRFAAFTEECNTEKCKLQQTRKRK